MAVVLFNRAGLAVGAAPPGNSRLPHFCADPASPNYPCTGCFVDNDKPWLAPCDDNATASSGSQEVLLELARLPRPWLGLDGTAAAGGGARGGAISCAVFDIFGNATPRGEALGHVHGQWSATIPPHGVRFIQLSNCTQP